MIFLAFAVSLVMNATDPAATPSAAPATPASQAAAAKPLREISYKFSDNRTSEYTSNENFGAPPASDTSVGGYSGMLTIDVLQVDGSGYIKAEAHEQTDAENGKAPFDAVFVIDPDGTLRVVSGTYDQDMTSLLTYFGSSFFGDNQLAQGNTWQTASTVDSLQLITTTTVTAVSGNDATIHSSTTAAAGVMRGSYDVETTVVYRAPKLVPISLDIVITRRASGDTNGNVQKTHFRFDRVSDTLDPPSGG